MGVCCSKAAPDVEMDVSRPKKSITIPGVSTSLPAKGSNSGPPKRKQSITETLMMEHGKGKGHRRLDEVYDTSDAVILGEGMSGRVATCRQRYTGELFALKTLSVVKLKVDMDELRQEIDILRRLDHPNIVKVYETFEEEGLFHVVMELCCGGQVETLATLNPSPRHTLHPSPRRAPCLTSPRRTPRHAPAPRERLVSVALY